MLRVVQDLKSTLKISPECIIDILYETLSNCEADGKGGGIYWHFPRRQAGPFLIADISWTSIGIRALISTYVNKI